MLDVLEHAKGSTPMNLEGETIAINDNKMLNNEVNEKWKKAGQHANDAGGVMASTKEIIETLSFEIKFRLITK